MIDDLGFVNGQRVRIGGASELSNRVEAALRGNFPATIEVLIPGAAELDGGRNVSFTSTVFVFEGESAKLFLFIFSDVDEFVVGGDFGSVGEGEVVLERSLRAGEEIVEIRNRARKRIHTLF